MAYISNILLGRIIKTNGYEGAVTVKLEKKFTEDIPQMESVFLEIDGRPVPFFISESEYSGVDILKLTFKGYASVNKVSEFTGCRVFLTSGSPEDNHSDDIPDLTGYTVVIKNDYPAGTITEVIENPGQLLLSVLSPENKEILIPLHKDFVVSINKKTKRIFMDIPDGLFDIN